MLKPPHIILLRRPDVLMSQKPPDVLDVSTIVGTVSTKLS
jgi:hypothetical protein